MSNESPIQNDANGACRREYFRLRYPITRRPTLIFSRRSYQVTELSEKGLRFHDSKLRPRFAVEMGTNVIQATLVLATTTIEVSGVPARRDRDEVVLVDVAGITFQNILEEQRRLASKFRTSTLAE